MLPWVRLHCIRDYSMAALLTCYRMFASNAQFTINLTPVLLRQIEAYVEGGCTDRALDLTLTPTSELTAGDRDILPRNSSMPTGITRFIHMRAIRSYWKNAAVADL